MTQSSEESVDDDFDFDDDEGSEDHQDYDANYFDNGEGDDDSGGEEGEFISCVVQSNMS
jgi:DNA-directed RNA polymerase III subunit RPC7